MQSQRELAGYGTMSGFSGSVATVDRTEEVLPMVRTALGCVLVWALVPGCGRHAAQPAVASAPQYPVIVRLVGRHQTITVTAGPRAPLYSASTSTGDLVVKNATLEQLRRDHPDLYQQIAPAMASTGDMVILAAD